MNHESKVILGIDPGYGRVGYGIIHKNQNTLTCETVGCIETSASNSHANRLYTVYCELKRIIEIKKPHVVALEQLFFAKNTKTALRVAETRGVLLLLSEEFNIPLREFTPLQVKMATCGYGRADKTQIQRMIMRIFKLQTLPKPDDAADALAIALTAAYTHNWG